MESWVLKMEDNYYSSCLQ